MTTLLLALMACGGPTPGTPTRLQPVRLALNWYPEPEFAGFYQGVLDGSYRRAGFDVEILPGAPGAPALELLGSGRVDVAVSSADELLLKRAKGIRAIGAWPVFQHSPQGLMVHAGGPVHAFEDIEGGAVAIEVGSAFQRFLWRRFGWDGRVSAVPYGGSVGPFLADPSAIQQAYVTSEPCVARAAGASVRFLPARDAGWDPYGTLVSFREPPPPWARPFLEATAAAWSAWLADPSAADAEIARLNPDMRPALIGCIDEAQRPFLVGEGGLGAMAPDRWTALASSLVELKLLPAGSSAEGAWSTLVDPVPAP